MERPFSNNNAAYVNNNNNNNVFQISYGGLCFFFFFIFSCKVREVGSKFLVLEEGRNSWTMRCIKEGVNRMFLKKLKTVRPKTIEGNN